MPWNPPHDSSAERGWNSRDEIKRTVEGKTQRMLQQIGSSRNVYPGHRPFSKPYIYLLKTALYRRWQDGVVGIATCYGLDGSGTESRWGRDFPHPSAPARGPTQPHTQRVSGLFRGWSRRGVALIAHPYLVSRLKRVRATPLLPFYVFMTGYTVKFTFLLLSQE